MSVTIDNKSVNALLEYVFPKYVEMCNKLHNIDTTANDYIKMLRDLEDDCWCQGATEMLKTIINDYNFQYFIYSAVNFANRKQDAAEFIYEYFYEKYDNENEANIKCRAAIVNGDDEKIAEIYLDKCDRTIPEYDMFQSIVENFYKNESEE